MSCSELSLNQKLYLTYLINNINIDKLYRDIDDIIKYQTRRLYMLYDTNIIDIKNKLLLFENRKNSTCDLSTLSNEELQIIETSLFTNISLNIFEELYLKDEKPFNIYLNNTKILKVKLIDEAFMYHLNYYFKHLDNMLKPKKYDYLPLFFRFKKKKVNEYYILIDLNIGFNKKTF